MCSRVNAKNTSMCNIFFFGCAAYRILPDQGSNLCPLHWAWVALPPGHRGSPCHIEWCCAALKPLQSDNRRLKLSAFLVCSFEPIPGKRFHVRNPLGIIKSVDCEAGYREERGSGGAGVTSAPCLQSYSQNTASRNQVPAGQAIFSTSLVNRPQLRPPPEILQLPQDEEEMKEERNGAGDRDRRMWTRRQEEGRGRGHPSSSPIHGVSPTRPGILLTMPPVEVA